MNAGEAQIPWSAPHIFFCLESNPEYRIDLLGIASRLPDVASRTLLCPFFSYRSLNQLAFSPCLGTLSLMCKHSMAQQKRYELEATSNEFGEEKDNSAGIADDVTFAAKLTKSLLERSAVKLGDALLSVFCDFHGRLFPFLCERLRVSAQDFLGDRSHDIKTMNTSRNISIVSQLTSKNGRERTNLSLQHFFPMSLASKTKVACDLGIFERTELLSRLGNLPVLFQARSRDEVKQQLNVQKVSGSNMTVVPPKHVFFPSWKRETRHSEEITETKSVDGSPTASPTTITPPLEPQEGLLSNVTWVKDGELALVNGRIVHREVKNSVQIEERKRRKTCSAKMEDTVEKTVSFEPLVSEGKKKQNTEHVQKKKVFREERDVSLYTANSSVISTQSLPLLSRDEVLALVNNLQISDHLREAFLIGLNDDASDNVKEENT